MFTVNEPNLSKLQKFGAVCFAYKQEKGKLESRSKQAIFIGYDKNSPAYLLYYPDTDKVQKHRLVKDTTKVTRKEEMQSPELHIECSERNVRPTENGSRLNVENVKKEPDQGVEHVSEFF